MPLKLAFHGLLEDLGMRLALSTRSGAGLRSAREDKARDFGSET